MSALNTSQPASSNPQTGGNENGFVYEHYLAITTIIGIVVAALDGAVLYLMHLDSISDGIGIALVGVFTFFGMMIASSVFEEHRHAHTPKTKKNGTTNTSRTQSALEKAASTAVAGKGIMRKAIASSLIIVYIILIGMYVENGELNEPFPGVDTSAPSEQDDSETNSATDSDTELTSSVNTAALQLIQDDSDTTPETEDGEETENSDESTDDNESADTTKPIPRSLMEHFSTVITVMIVFYFSSGILSEWFKSKYGKSQADSNPAPGAGSQQSASKKKAELQKKINALQVELNKL